jgi:hypothetical protein
MSGSAELVNAQRSWLRIFKASTQVLLTNIRSKKFFTKHTLITLSIGMGTYGQQQVFEKKSL